MKKYKKTKAVFSFLILFFTAFFLTFFTVSLSEKERQEKKINNFMHGKLQSLKFYVENTINPDDTLEKTENIADKMITKGIINGAQMTVYDGKDTIIVSEKHSKIKNISIPRNYVFRKNDIFALITSETEAVVFYVVDLKNQFTERMNFIFKKNNKKQKKIVFYKMVKLNFEGVDIKRSSGIKLKIDSIDEKAYLDYFFILENNRVIFFFNITSMIVILGLGFFIISLCKRAGMKEKKNILEDLANKIEHINKVLNNGKEGKEIAKTLVSELDGMHDKTFHPDKDIREVLRVSLSTLASINDLMLRIMLNSENKTRKMLEKRNQNIIADFENTARQWLPKRKDFFRFREGEVNTSTLFDFFDYSTGDGGILKKTNQFLYGSLFDSIGHDVQATTSSTFLCGIMQIISSRDEFKNGNLVKIVKKIRAIMNELNLATFSYEGVFYSVNMKKMEIEFNVFGNSTIVMYNEKKGKFESLKKRIVTFRNKKIETGNICKACVHRIEENGTCISLECGKTFEEKLEYNRNIILFFTDGFYNSHKKEEMLPLGENGMLDILNEIDIKNKNIDEIKNEFYNNFKKKSSKLKSDDKSLMFIEILKDEKGGTGYGELRNVHLRRRTSDWR